MLNEVFAGFQIVGHIAFRKETLPIAICNLGGENLPGGTHFEKVCVFSITILPLRLSNIAVTTAD